MDDNSKGTYIILTNTLGGTTGGVRYVANKYRWLVSQGWKVFLFSSTGQHNAPIVLDELMPFNNCGIKELYYYPNWINRKRRSRVINRVLSYIPEGKTVVIESNTSQTSIWGELIAQKANAKHIVFLIGENVKADNQQMADFFYFKYQRNELFTINEVAFMNLLSDYYTITDAKNHYWNANVDVSVKELSNDIIDHLPKAEYTISHFGRYKNYFPYMISEIAKFARSNKESKINFIFFGNVNKSLIDLNEDNVSVYFIEEQVYLPKSFFEVSDSIIATAGCALIAYRQGNFVVSMDVVRNKPLGVLGITTECRSFSDAECPEGLCSILNDILVENKYANASKKNVEKNFFGYEYQMGATKVESQAYYDNVMSIEGKISSKDSFLKIMLSLGLISVASNLRYRR